MTQASAQEPQVTIRPATREEIVEHVVPEWMNAYCRGFVGAMMRADSRHGTGRERYWSAMRARTKRALETETTTVRVVDVDGILAAWVVEDREQRVVHFVYTRDAFRRQGMASALLAWAKDGDDGDVVFLALPPAWFTRRELPEPGAPQPKRLWKDHQIIDLVSSV